MGVIILYLVAHELVALRTGFFLFFPGHKSQFSGSLNVGQTREQGLENPGCMLSLLVLSIKFYCNTIISFHLCFVFGDNSKVEL